MTGSNPNEFWRGMRLMLPMAAAGVLDGAAFGALAVAVMGHVAPIAMSLTAYSGSAQYASVSVLRDNGTVAAALLAAASLNVRYLAMSATVSARISGSRFKRAATCLLLTDAAWGVASKGEDRGTAARLAGAGTIDLVGWVTGTVVGVAFGSAIGNPETFGLDAAFPALFAWLLRDWLPDGTKMALIGGAIALALTPVLPPGIPVVIAGLAAGALGARE